MAPSLDHVEKIEQQTVSGSLGPDNIAITYAGRKIRRVCYAQNITLSLGNRFCPKSLTSMSMPI